jgi:hypothetical protein
MKASEGGEEGCGFKVSCGRFHVLEVSLETSTGIDEESGDDEAEKYAEVAVVVVPSYDAEGQWVQKPLPTWNSSAIFDGAVRWRVKLRKNNSAIGQQQHELFVNFVRPGLHMLATATRLITKVPQSKDGTGSGLGFIEREGVNGKWWVQGQPQCFVATISN